MMTTHPSEDELIQHASGDGAGVEQAVEVHLAQCETCRATVDQLREWLGIVTTTDVPEPPLGFEARIWAGVKPRITPVRPRWTVRQFVPLGALAAGVVALLSLGTRSDRLPGTGPTAASTNAETVSAPERVLLTALDDHFTQTEVLLVELLNAPAQPSTGFDFERSSAGDLVASGRLFRETAEATGQVQFASVLDELEPVLTEVARSSESIGSSDLQAWRSHIETSGLLFKVRIATAEVRDLRDPTRTESKGAL
jgi:hypothetical protein